MKVVFSRDDSINKIMKTLDKIPAKKRILIDIDSNNQFFDNIFWGRFLLDDILKKKQLKYSFVSKTKKSNKYLDQLGVPIVKYKMSVLQVFAKSVYAFFFKAKDIHVQAIHRRSYISYLVILFEIFVVIYFFYFFYSLVSPSAVVYIKPSYSLEEIAYNFRFYDHLKAEKYKDTKFLAIPYYTGKVDVSHSLSITVENVKYLQKASRGKVRLHNFTDKDYSLLPNTTFVTDNGLVFKAKNWFYIPPGNSVTEPTDIELFAEETDEEGHIIGERGNLKKGTIVWIKKLKESYYRKEVYATVEDDFVGGQTISDGIVSQKDIDTLSNLLIKYINENKKFILNDLLYDKSVNVLPFDDMYDIKNVNLKFNGSTGDKLVQFEGEISAQIHYKYFNWEDFEKVVNKYIGERKSELVNLVDIDRNSLIFYELKKVSDLYIIPTKVDIIWGYDFNKDINGLKSDIKNKVLGKTVGEAKDSILSFEEIDVAIIKISPPWYNVVPKLKSRIKVEITE